MRTSIILLIVLLLPLFLTPIAISYGSTATGSTQQLRSLMLKERIMTPDVNIMDDYYSVSLFLDSELQIKKLALKERIMTPDTNFDKGGAIVTIELPKTPLSSVYYQIDYNFIDDIIHEKQYIRHLND